MGNHSFIYPPVLKLFSALSTVYFKLTLPRDGFMLALTVKSFSWQKSSVNMKYDCLSKEVQGYVLTENGLLIEYYNNNNYNHLERIFKY